VKDPEAMTSYLTPPRRHHLILASQSPRRKQLLADAGIGVQQISAADIDETPERAELPAPYAERMARQKAAVIAAENPGQFVLAADTVVACGRRILPKAETAEQAAGCLDLLSGRGHRVYGGICLILPDGQLRNRLSISQVKFRLLDKADKRAYLASGEWQGKAGGYAIQGLAGLYIRKITGSYSNIVGLDMHIVAGLLLAAGFSYAAAD